MRFLIIDDDKSFAADLKSIVESLTGEKEIDLAHSQDSATIKISENFYDLIFLDLKLPTIDGAFDQTVSSGQAVLGHAKSVAFGTPIIVVTASVGEAEKYIPTILQHSSREVIWGDNVAIATVDHIAKGQLDQVRDKIAPIANSINVTKDIEINNRVTKSDLLLAGWHSIYYGDIDKELWAHPILIGDHPLNLAKKLHVKMKEEGIYDRTG